MGAQRMKKVHHSLFCTSSLLRKDLMLTSMQKKGECLMGQDQYRQVCGWVIQCLPRRRMCLFVNTCCARSCIIVQEQTTRGSLPFLQSCDQREGPRKFLYFPPY
ncbi:hypothetical protein AVEN_120400-1 [Araneus ventricosus]|uniref:Uncharacterized protein n=1 Tax=Araneus ventricosus TaxID=182803 RepID=A0A4Y2SPL6_ARAVE|nr:hypothetical protein AVEN_120400-1 [Araneus ventricosus]